MKKNGFTLIELLVSMGIVAVLTGLAVFNFNQSRLRARDVQRKSDMSQLKNALELYRNDNTGMYPSTATGMGVLFTDGYTKVNIVETKTGWWAYNYVAAADQKSYQVAACLENLSDGSRETSAVKCAQHGPSCACAGTSGVMYIVTSP